MAVQFVDAGQELNYQLGSRHEVMEEEEEAVEVAHAVDALEDVKTDAMSVVTVDTLQETVAAEDVADPAAALQEAEVASIALAREAILVRHVALTRAPNVHDLLVTFQSRRDCAIPSRSIAPSLARLIAVQAVIRVHILAMVTIKMRAHANNNFCIKIFHLI